MTTSTDRSDGTSNAERIAAEAAAAAVEVEERMPGYRARLAEIAVDCYELTAEHGEQRTNINQRYDQLVRGLAQELAAVSGEVTSA